MTYKEVTTEKKFTKKINGLYIDPIIFTFKFACECTGECCHYGVFMDKKEADNIIVFRYSMKHRIKIEKTGLSRLKRMRTSNPELLLVQK